jgi:hypothetical protein
MFFTSNQGHRLSAYLKGVMKVTSTGGEETLALLDLNDARTDGERRTLEELRTLLRRNLPVYLKRIYKPKPGRGMAGEIRESLRRKWCEELDQNPARRARFFVGLVVRDHLHELLHRAFHDRGSMGAFTIRDMTTCLINHAAKVRVELYPPGLRPEVPSRRKLSTMIVGWCQRGVPEMGGLKMYYRVPRRFRGLPPVEKNLTP